MKQELETFLYVVGHWVEGSVILVSLGRINDQCVKLDSLTQFLALCLRPCDSDGPLHFMELSYGVVRTYVHRTAPQ